MYDIAGAVITAATALLVAYIGWQANRSRARDDKQAAMIDDLQSEVNRTRTNMLDAESLLRETMDYVLVLRRALADAHAEIPPWPEGLNRR